FTPGSGYSTGAQRLAASLRSACHLQNDLDGLVHVLNASRRHCVRHTQPCVIAFVSWLCSTPRGVTAFGIRLMPLSVRPPSSAHRLAASLRSASTYPAWEPDRPQVLNASRRHCVRHPASPSLGCIQVRVLNASRRHCVRHTPVVCDGGITRG